MEALDGNAIAGELFEVFGAELTAATATCTACGATTAIAELSVYMSAPGIVARCRSCGAVVIVVVDMRDTTHIDLRGMAAIGVARRSPASRATQ